MVVHAQTLGVVQRALSSDDSMAAAAPRRLDAEQWRAMAHRWRINLLSTSFMSK
jgi:hypothetical protein